MTNVQRLVILLLATGAVSTQVPRETTAIVCVQDTQPRDTMTGLPAGSPTVKTAEELHLEQLCKQLVEKK